MKNTKIYIAGHEGMVGSALLRKIKALGYTNIIYEEFSKLDLRNQNTVNEYFCKHQPEMVFLIAGKVGGIQANINYPATFLYDNMMIAANVINAAKNNRVKKLLFLGSSCIYPRLAKQPMKEEYLLTGKLEPTNEGYAIGKIAGIKLCEYFNKEFNTNFISAIPPNLFGPGDNFSTEHSHVISALIKKIHAAKQDSLEKVSIWGTGSARREFMLTEDLVDGLLFLMNNYKQNEPINIGTAEDISIRELAEIIKEVVKFDGDIEWDKSKPDGMPQKLMDSGRINKIGWKPKYSFKDGIVKTYDWYKQNVNY
jgi:GDP-L-fucose synthase